MFSVPNDCFGLQINLKIFII